MWPKNKIPNLSICSVAWFQYFKLCIILKMLQARVTISRCSLATNRSSLTGHGRVHLRAFMGSPRAAGAGAIRGGPGWPVTALVLPLGGQAQGQVLEIPRVSQEPDKGLLLAERGFAVSECSWHACPRAVRPLPPKLHFLVPPSCTNREFFHPSFLPERSHGSHITASLK